jgi:SAM-dependent methyltransferase
MTTRESYDRLALAYAEKYYGELAHKPFDLDLLDRFADRVRGRGPVCDLGCGPGQVARYLKDRGVDAFGLDLSPGMIEQARRLNPDIRFEVGDLFALPCPDGAWAGVAAFYAIVHLPPDRLPTAFGELARVLQTDGVAVVPFHIGDEVLHVESLLGEEVRLDFHFFRPEAVAADLTGAGLVVEESLQRPPYEGVEYPSRRAYVVARKPA